MKYSSCRWTLFFLGLTLILRGGHVYAQPLSSEDVESLLPATPQTKNETVAAIVQDPVVKDAVQYAVGNGSLSGLVVKKNVVIIPANAPDQVLSHRQQILVAPTSHLEDIRKNITDGLQAETEDAEDNQSEELYQSIAEDDANKESESNSYETSYVTTLSNDLVDDRNDTYDTLKAILPSVKPQVELPEGTVTQKINISNIVEKDVPVPIVAVLDPSKKTDEKIESSIIALLPNVGPAARSDEDERLNYLEANREEIREDVQRFIDETSLSVDPEIWKRSIEKQDEIGTSPTTYDSQLDTFDQVTPERFILPTILLIPRNADSSEEDLSTAEDIVFRPLFRFRQEARHRADAYANRRYNSYQSYDSYPRRRYRPRYSYDYY